MTKSKVCGMIFMGVILSLLSALGLGGCEKNSFKPSKDAVLDEMSISYSGMMNGSQYYFSLGTDESEAIFNCEYYSSENNGEMINHKYEAVSVDISYMNELRKLAEENKLVEKMKKYRKPQIKYELLDGDMKSTTIVMSDGTRKTAETIFDSVYRDFFASVAEAYIEFDGVESNYSAEEALS